MQAPSTGLSLLIFALFVLPGSVFGLIFERLNGPTPNIDFSARVLRALTVSTLLVSLYLWLLGDQLVAPYQQIANAFDRGVKPGTDAVAAHVSDYGYWAALLLFLIPALASLLWFFLCQMDFSKRYVSWVWVPAPSAWDRMFASADNGEPFFVRILTKDGEWIGGGVDEDGFVTCWPADQQIYINLPWRMDADGNFTADSGYTQGLWVCCKEARAVELIFDKDVAGAGLLGR